MAQTKAQKSVAAKKTARTRKRNAKLKAEAAEKTGALRKRRAAARKRGTVHMNLKRGSIKNTFAPHVKNDYLGESAILMGLQFGIFKWELLSDDVKEQISRRFTPLSKQAVATGDTKEKKKKIQKKKVDGSQ